MTTTAMNGPCLNAATRLAGEPPRHALPHITFKRAAQGFRRELTTAPTTRERMTKKS